jgi:hypothetical protein
MAHSKLRWISTPTFLACIGGAHDRGEGTNVCKGARTAEGGGAHILGGSMRPLASRMRPIVCRMHPLRRRMRPFDRRMRPSARHMRPSTSIYAHSLPYAPLTQVYASLYQHMRPSDRRMRPTICRMHPLRKRMRPSDMRMHPSDMRMCPSASVCTPQPAVYAWSNPDHPTWQRCGSHRGQGKSKFTLSKVNKTLTLIGRTRTLSDVTDKRTDAQTTLVDRFESPTNIYSCICDRHDPDSGGIFLREREYTRPVLIRSSYLHY